MAIKVRKQAVVGIGRGGTHSFCFPLGTRLVPHLVQLFLTLLLFLFAVQA